MKAHRGQVAIYLMVVLVAIVALTIMNVNLFVIVRNRNHAMNAGDAAALAVAKVQLELLNEIGSMNVQHMRAALDDDRDECAKIAERQARLAFLGPLERGIAAGNTAAMQNGAKENPDMEDLLREHSFYVQDVYKGNPDIYPEPWEGAWDEYSAALGVAANNGIWAGPDNCDFIYAGGGHLLLNPQFYNAIAGSTWCWFKFNAPGLLDGYGGWESWGSLPTADSDTVRRRCANCEIYSLHLVPRTGSAVQLLGKEVVCRLTGASEDEVEDCALLNDQTQRWMFYDTSQWRRWWEIDPDFGFPVMGHVKPQYDVLGAAAVTRVYCEVTWVAAAKPFGSVKSAEGELKRVMEENGGLVTAAFETQKLVPVDSVAVGFPGETANAEWMRHVRKHLPKYLDRGTMAINSSCWYCDQLKTFENAVFRQRGVWWLKFHGNDCWRGSGGGNYSGGTRNGH